MKRLPRLTNRAIAALAILAAVLINAGFCYFLVQSNNSSIEAQRHAYRAHNRAVEARLCATFASLYADKPPAGNAANNPSRAYLQEQHARLGEVLPDLGCKGGQR